MENKRSNTYGFRVQGDRVIPAKSSDNIPGRYVGYPMGYWVEFKPAYGFHQGYVHLRPRSHGCLRLKGEAAAKFYALVRSRHAGEHRGYAAGGRDHRAKDPARRRLQDCLIFRRTS